MHEVKKMKTNIRFPKEIKQEKKKEPTYNPDSSPVYLDNQVPSLVFVLNLYQMQSWRVVAAGGKGQYWRNCVDMG